MAKGIPDIEEEWRRKVSFDFGKGGLAPPDGFRDLNIDEEITVIVTGKVNDLHQGKETSSFSLYIGSVEIQAKKKGKLTAALEKSRQRV